MPRQKPARNFNVPQVPLSRDLPFPLLIRAYRQRAGMGIRSLAETFYLNPTKLSQFERGVSVPNEQIAIELSRALQLSEGEREHFLDRAAMARGKLPGDLAEWPGMVTWLHAARRAKAAESGGG